MEIRGVQTDDSGLSFGNGVTYWTNSSADWVQSQNPSLGAVACYYTIGSSDPGHVAIVEQIIDNDTIVVSESDYGNPAIGLAGVYFRTVTCYRQYGWRPAGWNVYAQGFLINPYVDPTPVPPSHRKPIPIMEKFMILNKKIKCHR
jgi:surface antigen